MSDIIDEWIIEEFIEDSEIEASRGEICNGSEILPKCKFAKAGMCIRCGCIIAKKIRAKTDKHPITRKTRVTKCPINKW